MYVPGIYVYVHKILVRVWFLMNEVRRQRNGMFPEKYCSLLVNDRPNGATTLFVTAVT